MITYSTKIENNQFKVTWDFSPKDVKCSRGNYTATHKGGGTTSRKGIWEGIELVSAEVKVGNGPWTNFGTNSKVTVYTTDNNVEFLAVARYRLKTMGYHFQCTNGQYPFFYYGNVGGNASRYAHGHFTDGSPHTPAQLYDIHAIVPKDWTHTATAWSDWAYKNAEQTSNWTCNPGRYEKRNGNTESATTSNGWISDSGYKQTWRKSCMFTFEKVYSYKGVISSGIVKDASVPELTVIPTKGDSGNVTVKYIDKNDSNGKLWLRAYCKDRQVEIMNYDQSQTFSNGNSKTFNVNFVDLFGESYRGSDITYEAWAKNSHNKESARTGKKGGHRFNGRPSVPGGLYVSGRNDIIYDKITFKWNQCTDPDGDTVVYDLWLKAIRKDGSIIRDDYIIREYTGGLTYDYDIANHPDGTKYVFRVRSSDNRIASTWSNELHFEKGAKPTGALKLISPSVENTIIYSEPIRLAFNGHDQISTFVVNINGEDFAYTSYPHLYTIEGSKIMFLANMIHGEAPITIYAYLKNEYGTSEKSAVYTFNKKNPYNNIAEGNIAKTNVIKEIQQQIKDKAKAYGISPKFTEIIPKETLIDASIYNECYNALKAINDNINSIINTSTFDVQMTSSKVSYNDLHDDILWKNLIQDIKKI